MGICINKPSTPYSILSPSTVDKEIPIVIDTESLPLDYTGTLGLYNSDLTPSQIAKMIPKIRDHATGAINGIKESQYVIGYAYDIGTDGLSVSTKDAVRFYMLSAKQDFHPSMYNLGVMFSSGHGNRCPTSINGGFYWFEKAAEFDNPCAQFHVGYYLYRGDTLSGQDLKRAASYFKKAAHGEFVLGESGLGLIYITGEGVDVDYKKARKWLKKAALKNDSMALYNMGYLFKNGLGVKANEERANSYFSLAREGTNPTMVGDPEFLNPVTFRSQPYVG